ncbi:MAG TPA: hypothetical protein DCQ06_01190, partial [Myxococcales bacterium]|nr:hypothetical protein [Myxococcales bacterium]
KAPSVPLQDIVEDSTSGAADAQSAADTTEPDTAVVDATEDTKVRPADKPLATQNPPQSQDSSGWVAAVHYSGTPDQIGAAVANGSFAAPAAGTKAYEKAWVDAKPTNGQMGPFGNGSATVWLAGTVKVDDDVAAILRLDRIRAAYVNGIQVPGDVYGHGLARVAVPLKKGENLVVVRGRGGQKVRVGIETSSAELHLNALDWTFPELRVGSDASTWMGVPLLELTGSGQSAIRCRVVDSDHWKGSEVALAGLAPLATSHASFRLLPKSAWTEPTKEGDKGIPVTLRVESMQSDFAYQWTLHLKVLPADAKFRQTFLSPVDRSVQYYGVVPPTDFDSQKSYGLALSLHGASVEAKGQANSYSPKDWLYVVAPTNRRRFGFDWEEWGHLNGLAALNDAKTRFNTDPLRTYVTGHSMGGHGTWQFGVHHADLFAVVGPSAGWDSFYTYGGSKKPTGPFIRARAHSDTSSFLSNLSNRAVYVIHGTADDNVPWSEGKNLYQKAKQHTSDIQYHWQQGAGHWWNGDKSKGADCVDWPDLFTLMKERKLNPTELTFSFTTPGPWYSESYSYARVRSAKSPEANCKLVSSFDGATLVLNTTNVRTLEIDGAALKAKGLTKITLNGEERALSDEPLIVGPTTGKRPGVHGPYNQVMHTPWCWVWPKDKPVYGAYVSYLSSTWAIIGNGQGCAVSDVDVSDEIAANYNLIHVGRSAKDAGAPDFVSWDDAGVTMAGKTFAGSAIQLIWDSGDRLHAAMWAPKGQESLLYMVVPFSSRSGMPDFLIWGNSGLSATGNFAADWSFDPNLAIGF